MEMADGVVITKADGDNLSKANQACADFQYALHLFLESDSKWKPTVLTSSALENRGIKETWDMIDQYVKFTTGNLYFKHQREQQDLAWFRERVQLLLQQELSKSEKVKSKIKLLEQEILTKKTLPSKAAQQIIDSFFSA